MTKEEIKRKCRICGCTDKKACKGGCNWATWDICSNCVSKNERAEKVCGLRVTGANPIDFPCELGYHCPVCKYKLMMGNNYDDRLDWSEYNNFIYCNVCNKDYPSPLCMPDVKRATEIFLDILEWINQPKLK